MSKAHGSRRSTAAILLAIFALATLVSRASSGLDTTGRWTSKYDLGARWNHIPVHLVLTRSYTGHHSQILWYNSHPENDLPGDSLRGGVWAWDPAIGTHEANCDSYPANSFKALTHGQPLNNIFCTGHTILPDGRVLIAGGSENGAEVGEKRSIIFDPSSRNFTTQGDMSGPRWYPTVTTLPNGKALVTSGSTYEHQWFFGGQPIPDTSDVYADSLGLLGDTDLGQWDPRIKDSTSASTGDWPSSQVGHSAAFNDHNAEMTVFGGATSHGASLTNNTYFVYRNPDTDGGAHYKGVRVAQTSAIQPTARCWQTAVVPGDSTMIVFGGRELFHAKNDLYELKKASASVWDWRVPPSSGPAPSPRQGHTAVWDPENNCMLVYGGVGRASLTDAPLAADTLFVLTRGSTWTWTAATVDTDLTYGVPGPRYGHAMVVDQLERYTGPTGAPDADHDRRALLFGGKGPGGLLNDLWALWIPNAGTSAHYKWQRIPPPTGAQPSPRMRFAMYADQIKDRLVISGGTVGDSATASTWSILLNHISASNDNPWVALANFPYGPVTGHSASFGALNWNFGQDVFDPGTGNWTAQTSRKRQDWYPFGFVAPQTDSLRIFYAGPDTQSYYYNLSAATPYWRPFPATPTTPFRSGSAVMYLPGKVMRTGSRDTDAQFSAARGKTQILDLQGSPTPSAWTDTDTMSARVNHNLVILPTGMVLAVGGTSTVHNPLNEGPVFRPQMWRPSTATWTSMTGIDTLAADSTIRGYHSNAILLPDGRVLSISGNDTNDDTLSQGHLDAVRATVFCPPYLFDGSGNLKTRPAITISSQTDYNTTFTVCVDNAGTAPTIGSICLIRPAASTHAFNMDQRFVPLTWQSNCRGRQLIVTSPANSSIAPPGDYLLFAVKTDSMPSIAQWIRLGVADEAPPDCIDCGGSGEAMIAGGDGGSESAVLTGRNATMASTNTVAAVRPVPENALLVEPSGERLYRLRSDPTSGGQAQTRIIQDSGGQTTLDAATLSAVDHAAGTAAYGAGDHVLIGVEAPVASVRSSKGSQGAPITGSVVNSTPWAGSDGDTLTVDLTGAGGAQPDGGSPLALLINARRGARDVFGSKASPDIVVLAPDGNGGEIALSKAEPRWGFDDIVIEHCPSRMRIAAGIGTQIQRIAQIVSADSSTAGTPLRLVTATAPGNIDAIGAVSAVGGEAVSIAQGDTVSMRWALPPAPAEGQVRSYFLRVASTTVSTDSSLQATAQLQSTGPVYVFALHGARPNPFSSETTIEYSLARSARATLRLYNVAGRLVRTLVDGQRPAGPASIVWNGTDNRGVRVGAGVYFARLESGANRSNRKMILVGR